MLKNRKYIGEYKYMYIVIPNGVPAIVSEDIFKKVQKKMERNKYAPAKEKARSIYLYDDKLIITYNFRDRAKTITLEEVNNSDLVLDGPPNQSNPNFSLIGDGFGFLF